MLPLAVTIALRPAMYNGIRHFVFVLPPLAVLGGLAADWLARMRRAPFRRFAPLAGAIVLVMGSAPCRCSPWCGCTPTSTRISTGCAGGVRGAHGRYMLDYWGLAFKQASQSLLANP